MTSPYGDWKPTYPIGYDSTISDAWLNRWSSPEAYKTYMDVSGTGSSGIETDLRIYNNELNTQYHPSVSPADQRYDKSTVQYLNDYSAGLKQMEADAAKYEQEWRDYYENGGDTSKQQLSREPGWSNVDPVEYLNNSKTNENFDGASVLGYNRAPGVSSSTTSAPATSAPATPSPTSTLSSTSEPAPEPWNFEYGANKTPAITDDFESNQSNNALSNNVDTINSYMEDSDSFNSFATVPLPAVNKKGSVFEDIMNATKSPTASPQTFANVIANTY